jgi:hypothetical protein
MLKNATGKEIVGRKKIIGHFFAKFLLLRYEVSLLMIARELCWTSDDDQESDGTAKQFRNGRGVRVALCAYPTGIKFKGHSWPHKPRRYAYSGSINRKFSAFMLRNFGVLGTAT